MKRPRSDPRFVYGPGQSSPHPVTKLDPLALRISVLPITSASKRSATEKVHRLRRVMVCAAPVNLAPPE